MNGAFAVIIICVSTMALAQTFKFIGYSIYSKKLRLDMWISTGGMPSSHSALVTSLFVSILLFTIESGNPGDAYYVPIALVLALVVVHDSMGIRYEVSKHAQILNKLIKDLGEVKKKELGYEKDLKEYLGHRPIEAMCGVIFGIALGIIGFFILRPFV